tara:strand:+ start:2687 stop:2986 length:300 start_codon:yes stop_codon:yes gene_type:complete
MDNINYIETIPEHIKNFINANTENIINIIEEEKKNRGDGIIYINIVLKENKLDLVYLTNAESKETLGLTEEFLEKIKTEGKTSIIINDNEYKTRFILYL